FEAAEKYGIRNSENMYAVALHVCGLYDGALDGIAGKYYENDIYHVDEADVAAFDRAFPPKEAAAGTPSQRYFLEIAAKCRPFEE
ncbi:MAG: GNAT family N-acetyltransferase, partial [Alphaproteobacteria bacterium]|nr:GNAT family N-acetyltransferase [Alphaproteobacteria bacterium]